MANRRGTSRPDDEIDEGPSERDLEAFGDVTRNCPECNASLYDDVDVCYKCGHALLARRGLTKKPIWITVVIVLVILATLSSLLRFP